MRKPIMIAPPTAPTAMPMTRPVFKRFDLSGVNACVATGPSDLPAPDSLVWVDVVIEVVMEVVDVIEGALVTEIGD